MLNAGGPPHQQAPAVPAGAHPAGVQFQMQPPLPQQQQPQQPPPPMAGLVPIVGHCQYMHRYQDASLDPYNGLYDGLMEVFAVPLQGPAVPPATLMSQVADSTLAGVPSAFLLLIENPVNPDLPGTLMCFHRLSKFPARLSSPSYWDNRFFAFAGDSVGPQITTVIWRSEFFNQVNGGALLRIPTEAQADAELGIFPTPTTLGPYHNQDAGTETVRTRRAMIVPPAYIRLFLSGSMSPVAAYQRFRVATTADGTTQAMLPLSIWLRAAINRTAINDPSPLQGPGPLAPIADPDLHRFTWSALTHDLPAVDPGTQANPGLHAVAGSLGTLVHEQRQARQEAARAREISAAPKSIEAFFRSRLPKLLRFCRVNSPDDLPPVYTEVANCKAKDLVQTMQDAINIAAEDLQLGQSLIITPAMSKKLVNVSWAMANVDDLETGIHHFHVVQQGPDGMAAAHHLVATMDLLHSDGTTFHKSRCL